MKKPKHTKPKKQAIIESGHNDEIVSHTKVVLVM